MLSRAWRGAAVVALSLAPVATAWADGDLSLRIAKATELIKASPKNADLYIDRGELHRIHQDWDAARADFKRAEELRPGWALLDLARGRLEVESGNAAEALAALDRYLATDPDHGGALNLRAAAAMQMGRHLAAARDYTRALAIIQDPTPWMYLGRAQALEAAGPDHFEEALRGLDEGMKKIGPAITLQLPAIELEVKCGHWDAAIARIEQAAAPFPRKESWLARKADVLEKAGRAGEAREVRLAAVAALEALSPRHRYTKSMQDLEKNLRSSLEATR